MHASPKSHKKKEYEFTLNSWVLHDSSFMLTHCLVWNLEWFALTPTIYFILFWDSILYIKLNHLNSSVFCWRYFIKKLCIWEFSVISSGSSGSLTFRITFWASWFSIKPHSLLLFFYYFYYFLMQSLKNLIHYFKSFNVLIAT